MQTGFLPIWATHHIYMDAYVLEQIDVALREISFSFRDIVF